MGLHCFGGFYIERLNRHWVMHARDAYQASQGLPRIFAIPLYLKRLVRSLVYLPRVLRDTFCTIDLKVGGERSGRDHCP